MLIPVHFLLILSRHCKMCQHSMIRWIPKHSWKRYLSVSQLKFGIVTNEKDPLHGLGQILVHNLGTEKKQKRRLGSTNTRETTDSHDVIENPEEPIFCTYKLMKLLVGHLPPLYKGPVFLKIAPLKTQKHRPFHEWNLMAHYEPKKNAPEEPSGLFGKNYAGERIKYLVKCSGFSLKVTFRTCCCMMLTKMGNARVAPMEQLAAGRHAHLDTTALYQELGPETNAQHHLALQNHALKLLPLPTVSDGDKKPAAEDKKSAAIKKV
jgi:hypothetical protein